MAYKYPTHRAEGISASGGGDGSLLEEYLDHILVLPVEIRRNVSLMRELDLRCMEEKKQLEGMQNEFLRKLKERFSALRQNKAKDNVEEREKIVAEMRKTNEYQKIETLRKTLKQKALEKVSVSDQLCDISEQNLKKIEGDIERFQNILRQSGELVEETTIQVGKLVAACTPQPGAEDIWILCRVVESKNASNQKNPVVIVADVDNAAQEYKLALSQVVLLCENEDVAAAKSRLPGKGRVVMAMYPDTTSFYKSNLVALPYKSQTGESVCVIQFHDDEDATGVIPRRILPTKYVFRSQN